MWCERSRCRSIEPHLLARCGVQNGAVKAQPVPVHHGVPQLLQPRVELHEPGLALAGGERGSRSQVCERLSRPFGQGGRRLEREHGAALLEGKLVQQQLRRRVFEMEVENLLIVKM
jgi:hypothetical protein